MAQTSVDFLWRWWNDNPFAFYKQGLKAYRQAKEMHKVDCISFAEEWEIRCNEKNMDSKEQLYDEIYNKQ